MKGNLISTLILIFLLLTNCFVDNKKIIDKEEPQYKTTDPSELFFKNVRALYYDKEEMTDAKLEIFRIKTRSQSEGHELNLAIVLNWRFDEAYILIEPGDKLAGIKEFTLVWEKESFKGEEEYILGNKDLQFTIATAIYEHILEERDLYWSNQGKKIPLLQSKKDREAFRVTMFDFYNLVELL